MRWTLLTAAGLLVLGCGGDDGKDAGTDPAVEDVLDTADVATDDEPESAPECWMDSDCDDSDPCTEDTCTEARRCEHTALSGLSTLLEDVRVTHDPAGAQQTALAWTGSSFAVAWSDGREGPYEIYVRMISAEGTPTGTDTGLTSGTGQRTYPSIAWTGSELGLIWTDTDATSPGIHFVRVSADGTPVGSGILLSDPAATDASANSIAWTGSELCASWEDSRDGNAEIYLARISASGEKVGSDVRVTDDTLSSIRSSLAWTGSELGVAWQAGPSTGHEIYFARLDPTGAKIGTDVRITDDPAMSGVPSLHWTGSEFGVSWMDERFPPAAVHFARISAEGVKIGDDEMIVACFTWQSSAWTGSRYGVVWPDGPVGSLEIYMTEFSEDGTSIGSMVQVSSSGTHAHTSSVAWTGSLYGIAWLDSRDGLPEVYFNLVASCE